MNRYEKIDTLFGGGAVDLNGTSFYARLCTVCNVVLFFGNIVSYFMNLVPQYRTFKLFGFL